MALAILYTRDDVMDSLGITKSAFHRKLKSGEFKMLKNKRFNEQAIMDYLEITRND